MPRPKPAPEGPPSHREQFMMTKQPVTLDGNPAVISGVHMAYAKVTDPETGASAEFSWDMIRHYIRHNEGKFES